MDTFGIPYEVWQIITTCSGALGAYFLGRKRYAKFDVYARTAELEHELGIEHIDQNVIDACTVDHVLVAEEVHPELQKDSMGRYILPNSIMSMNEAREIRAKWLEMYVKGQEPTMLYADGHAIAVIPSQPDLDIVEEEYR